MNEKEMYKEIIEKRITRKREQLAEIEAIMQHGEVTAVEKRNYMELKAVIRELENVIDLAETVLK